VSLSHRFVHIISKYLNLNNENDILYHYQTIIKSFIRTIIIILGVLISLKISNIDSTYFLSGIGILGVVIPFSLQLPIQDLMTGVMLTAFDKLNIGDYVTIDNNISGEIVSVDAFSTYLKDPSTNLIIDVPHVKIWNLPTTSIYRSHNFKIKLEILISHRNNIRNVENIIKNKVLEHNNVKDVTINYSTSDVRGLMLNVIVSTTEKTQIPKIKKELYKMVKLELQDKNIIFVDGNYPVSVSYKTSSRHPIIIEN
tara:strand:+ start:246 stop:1007 length:762 start_codon:yes stop_codon:yes gene_type:complete